MNLTRLCRGFLFDRGKKIGQVASFAWPIVTPTPSKGNAMPNPMSKIIKKIDDNRNIILYYAATGTISILAGVVVCKHIQLQFQKEMFAQLEQSLDDLGLTEQVIKHMLDTPPYPPTHV
jgi:hypothetical protein